MKIKLISLLAIIVFSTLIISCNNSTNNSENKEVQEDNYISSLIETPLGYGDYKISIPENYIIDETEGPDFWVYYIYPEDSTDLSSFRGGLYLGGHPSEFSAENEDCSTEKMFGKILEQNKSWTVYNCDGTISIQTIVDGELDQGYQLRIHAFGNCATEEDMKNLFKVFSTMK